MGVRVSGVCPRFGCQPPHRHTGFFCWQKMANHEFTGVFIPAHIWLSKELEPAEKMLLGEIEALSKKTGWCSAGRKHFAEWLNCSEPNVSYYTAKLERMGFVEVKRTPGFGSKMRVVLAKFYADQPVNGIDGGSKEALRGVVNRVYGGGKEDLPVNTIEIQKNKEREEREKTTPPPSEISTLEAEKEKPPQIPPAPPTESTRVIVFDPAAPGAKILDIVPSEPQTPPPPHRINLGDRATAETPTQLHKEMLAFYNSPDWQGEWLDGVWKINGVWIPDNAEKQKRLENILLDFCCHTVKKNGGRDTYRELNAGFQQWVRNEKNAFWKQKAAPGQSVSQSPDQNFYRRNNQAK